MSDHIVAPIESTSRPLARRIVVAVMVLLMVLIVANVVQSRAQATRATPQSAAIENALGVRFSRVAVVADGGLVTVSYVVLDQEKATRFQSDREHPPVLSSEERAASTRRVSLMKQGHLLRAGQTYYLVYQNTRGALRPGEMTDIEVGPLHLRHFPVL